MNPKVAQMLGLAMRARKIVTGEGPVLQAVRSHQAKLVIVAADASANTVKKVTDKCSFYQVPCHRLANRYELGRAIGKDARVTVAVTDSKLAESIIRHLLTPNS
jgi:ribosomal protein L7Ae-like RNA K-turn-binding protein